MDKKILMVATHAGENPDKASVPFVMGNAGLSSNMDVTIVL